MHCSSLFCMKGMRSNSPIGGGWIQTMVSRPNSSINLKITHCWYLGRPPVILILLMVGRKEINNFSSTGCVDICVFLEIYPGWGGGGCFRSLKRNAMPKPLQQFPWWCTSLSMQNGRFSSSVACPPLVCPLPQEPPPENKVRSQGVAPFAKEKKIVLDQVAPCQSPHIPESLT